jgi:hypothetical protein
MDLGAYIQIGELEHLLKENNIEIPRLRGLRLMKDEQKFTREELEEEAMCSALESCESLIKSDFNIHNSWTEESPRTRRLVRKYLIMAPEASYPIGVRWENIHGKRRKMFKYIIKKEAKRCRDQLEKFNSYVGRDDVLYIHARIGGGNWPYYRTEVETRPWFIEKINDCYDSTYCDIYARITP